MIAVGIDTEGRKHVPGLRDGATETAAVATGRLNDFVPRGLPTDRTMLFLLDAAQALRRAITDLYGRLAIIQRCQAHQYRNVPGHLPERLHANVGRALRTAWDVQSATRAKRALQQLARSLERDNPRGGPAPPKRRESIS